MGIGDPDVPVAGIDEGGDEGAADESAAAVGDGAGLGLAGGVSHGGEGEECLWRRGRGVFDGNETVPLVAKALAPE